MEANIPPKSLLTFKGLHVILLQNMKPFNFDNDAKRAKYGPKNEFLLALGRVVLFGFTYRGHP
jgi:hypothetical protein